MPSLGKGTLPRSPPSSVPPEQPTCASAHANCGFSIVRPTDDATANQDVSLAQVAEYADPFILETGCLRSACLGEAAISVTRYHSS
jgi:hypothetical protein